MIYGKNSFVGNFYGNIEKRQGLVSEDEDKNV
jgi:hypothetical protein